VYAIGGYIVRMKIGILGTDPRAIAIGRLMASSGHDTTFSDARDGQAAQRAADEAGARAETLYSQAMTRELLVVACERADVDAALAAIGPHVYGVVLDAMDGGLERLHHGAELLARKLDTHRLVRALVVLPQAGANVPICGDDAAAKALVNDAFVACGCLTTDRGPLSNAPELEPPTVLRGDAGRYTRAPRPVSRLMTSKMTATTIMR
jgi:predicted dinucleotide-binding enzyme